MTRTKRKVLKTKVFCSNPECNSRCIRYLTNKVIKEAHRQGLWLSVACFDCANDEREEGWIKEKILTF